VHIHQVGFKATLRDTGRVQTDAALNLLQTVTHNAAANHRLLTADFADTGHDVFSLTLNRIEI
jgi:hypothetical protein